MQAQASAPPGTPALFTLHRIAARDFRCFQHLDLELEPDLTVLFAENGGGKTQALAAVAALLGAWFTPIPGHLWSTRESWNVLRHIRTPSGAWEPVGPCELEAQATVAGEEISWRHRMELLDARNRSRGLTRLRQVARRVLRPGQKWPLLAWYGTQRLFDTVRLTVSKRPPSPKRWDGYTDCLDPRSSEKVLLAWLERETIADLHAHQQGHSLRGLAQAVLAALVRATPGMASLDYDFALAELRATFDDGREVSWSQLSDGYRVFMDLVADIARRAIVLNDHLGPAAVEQAEGVVLIDEVDLHLHPRWQVEVLHGLRRAFPRLQFVVTTHSPLVLSSAENRQIRPLRDLRVAHAPVWAHGRDANAITRDAFLAQDRHPWGRARLSELHAAIDRDDQVEARRIIEGLRATWGPHDGELAWAESYLDAERGDP